MKRSSQRSLNFDEIVVDNEFNTVPVDNEFSTVPVDNEFSTVPVEGAVLVESHKKKMLKQTKKISKFVASLVPFVYLGGWLINCFGYGNYEIDSLLLISAICLVVFFNKYRCPKVPLWRLYEFFADWSHVVINVILFLPILAHMIVVAVQRMQAHEYADCRVLLAVFVMVSGAALVSNPRHVPWVLVCRLLCLHYLLAMLLFGLTSGADGIGLKAINYVGEKTLKFFSFSAIGAKFVYGDFLVTEERAFAFYVLAPLFMFYPLVNVLRSFGIIDRLLHWSTGFKLLLLKNGQFTTIELFSATTNSFFGGNDIIVSLKDKLDIMADNEFYVLLVSSLATPSITAIYGYAGLNIDVRYMVASSLLSIFSSLAFARLVMPNTQPIVPGTPPNSIGESSLTEKNISTCFINGVNDASVVVLSIIGLLIAVISFVFFSDAALITLNGVWAFADAQELGLFKLVGYLFSGFLYMIGFQFDEEQIVDLFAKKVLLNEFYAYQEMGYLIDSGDLSVRFEAMATVLLCNFGNISAAFIFLATINIFKTRPLPTHVCLYALVTSFFVSFYNVAIVNLFY